MDNSWQNSWKKIAISIITLAWGEMIFSFLLNDVAAQIIPDNTLEGESSLVTLQQLRDLIEGGAIRSNNLFHSFLEFSINEGQEVYFANPEGVENIFTRVTGSNPSDIFGTLGVDGAANLILVNPNGIHFGPNSVLDVTGSFFATTADSIIFPNGEEFSATNPQAPPLLKINITPGLQYGVIQPESRISNSGNLSVGENLSLVAGNLDLQGQLQAHRNLTLQAINIVKIFDSETNPFIANAGEKLLIQGNQSIDIFALNHPQSGLFANGDLQLISPQPIQGDIHYYTGGNFLITQPDGSLGNFISTEDPVIRANGDVSLASYTGASLHILAGGSITIPGTIEITSADNTNNSLTETITLSDGTNIFIDGNAQPTLDIRAGINPEFLLEEGILGTITPEPQLSDATNANINLGDIVVTNGGTVLLTNQYQLNPALNGDININSINTTNDLDGGLVVLDARNNITLNTIIDTFSTTGRGGDVNLLANGNINLPLNASIFSDGLLGSGNINLNSNESISIGFGFVGGFTTGIGDGGDVNLTAPEILLDGSIIFTTMDINAQGQGGDININTDLLSANFGFVVTETFGVGNVGNVNLNADEIDLDGVTRLVSQVGINEQTGQGGSGQGGNVNINANSLSVRNGSLVQVLTLGSGDAGDLNITADSVLVEGAFTLITTEVFPNATGQGGNVSIITNSLSLSNLNTLLPFDDNSDSIQIRANTLGQGDAGDILINANSVLLDGKSFIVDEVELGSEGRGGNITINTDLLSLTNGGFISTSSAATEDAGNITINANSVILDGVLAGSNNNLGSTRIDAATLADGQGGEINLSVDNLLISNGATITSASSNFLVGENLSTQGDAGNININATDFIAIDGVGSNGQPSGIFSNIQSNTQGDGGDISIETNILSLTNSAEISVGSEGFDDSNAGNINIRANQVNIEEEAGISAATFGTGNAGNVTIQGNLVEIIAGGEITAITLGVGNAGSINLEVNEVEVRGFNLNSQNPSRIASFSGADGVAGSIIINGDNLTVGDGGEISVSGGMVDAGNLMINSTNAINLDDQGSLRAEVNAGNQGNIDLSTELLLLRNNSNISTNAQGFATGGNITINTTNLVALENSDITANAIQGSGGNIDIVAQGLFLATDSQITASSQFGVDGVVTINNPEADLSNSLIELPTDTSDASQKIVQGCDSNIAESSFSVTGRGGLPLNPRNSPTSDTVIDDWLDLEPVEREKKRAPTEENNQSQVPRQIVEAQGWIVGPNGNVILTAQPNQGSLGQTGLISLQC